MKADSLPKVNPGEPIQELRRATARRFALLRKLSGTDADEAFIQRFLEREFRGITRAVDPHNLPDAGLPYIRLFLYTDQFLKNRLSQKLDILATKILLQQIPK